MGLRREVPYLGHFRENEGMIYTLFTLFEGERPMGVWNSNATSKRNMIEGEAVSDFSFCD